MGRGCSDRKATRYLVGLAVMLLAADTTATVLPDCVDSVQPGLVVLVSGLVDLASEDPGNNEEMWQDDAVFVLVNAVNGVPGPCAVHAHDPVLRCQSNCELVGPAGSMQRLSLANLDIEFPAGAADRMLLHQEVLDSGPRPDPDNACSLRWLPNVGKMSGKALKAGVFGRPDPALVTSKVTFGRGEVFTYDFWMDADSNVECMFTIPKEGPDRAMAKTVGVVLPLAAGNVPFRVIPSDAYPEHWNVRALDPTREVVVELVNMPTSRVTSKDFTAHYLLRAHQWTACRQAPNFKQHCVTPPPALDPQCTPNNNTWP